MPLWLGFCGLEPVEPLSRGGFADPASPSFHGRVGPVGPGTEGWGRVRAVHGEGEEGAFLPVPFPESSGSQLQAVHTAGADVASICDVHFSPLLCCTQALGLAGSSNRYRGASTISQ